MRSRKPILEGRNLKLAKAEEISRLGKKKQEYHYDLFKDGAWEAALSELAPPSLEKEGTKLLRLNKLLGNLISSGEPELPNPFLDKA